MPNNIKRHFFNHVDYVLDHDAKTVALLPAFHEKLQQKKLWNKFGFKKVGGSSLGDVLGLDMYKSQFAAFCRIAWIGLPILDRKYVDAGIAIEPKVVKLIEKVSKKHVEVFDPIKYKFDYFAGKHDFIGGIPDGYIAATKTIIEIKTTGAKNYDKWQNYGIPVSYLRQAQLYAHLMDVERFSIVATFLEEGDYVVPENYPIEKRITKNWNYQVNHAQVLDDIAKVEKWYQNVTQSGVSPPYDERLDQDLLAWLACRNQDEWEKLKQKWITIGKLVI